MGIYAWLKLLNSTLAAEVPIIASMLLQNDPEATKPYPSRRPSAIRPDTGQPTAQPWEKMEKERFLSAEGSAQHFLRLLRCSVFQRFGVSRFSS